PADLHRRARAGRRRRALPEAVCQDTRRGHRVRPGLAGLGADRLLAGPADDVPGDRQRQEGRRHRRRGRGEEDERGLRVRGMTAPTRPSAARPGRPADLRGGPRARGTGRPSPPARRRPGTSRTPWLYLAPALVVLGGLLAYPIYPLGLISLFHYPQAQVRRGEPTTLKRLGNYSELL